MRSCVPLRSEISLERVLFCVPKYQGDAKECERNANWNAPRTRSVLIFLLGYFCPVLYITITLCTHIKLIKWCYVVKK